MRRYSAALAGLSLIAAAAGPAAGQSPGRTTKDGVFTAAQAERGGKVAADSCAACHAAELTGGPDAPSLRGPEFTFTWKGRSVAELFDYVKTKMPPAQPGSLSDRQYIDVVATILRGNDAPVGAAELTADAAANGAIKIAP